MDPGFLGLSGPRWGTSRATGRPAFAEALSLAIEIRHPVYDCIYIALALKRNIPFITADAKLIETARKKPRLADRLVLLSEVEP